MLIYNFSISKPPRFIFLLGNHCTYALMISASGLGCITKLHGAILGNYAASAMNLTASYCGIFQQSCTMCLI